MREPVHFAEYASTAEEIAVQKIQIAQQSLSQMNFQDDLSCNCKMGTQPNTMQFETPESCGEERNYLLGDLENFKKNDSQGNYVKPRDYNETATIFPRKCVLYIMRKFWKDRAQTPLEKREADIEYNRNAGPNEQRTVKPLEEYKQDPHIFSTCVGNSNGIPERIGMKPCVTENYVNLVYNSLLDVGDCLNVPLKFIAPKLSNESGMHVNAFGMVNDGGIGQFTKQALVDVVSNYDEFYAKIKNSPKESCKRIRTISGAIPTAASEILIEDENRCHAISTPPNPLRSLVYYGMFFHATRRNALKAFERVGDEKDPNFKSVAQLMDQAGIGHLEKQKIKDMLLVMAYNFGPGRPVTSFKEWIRYRLQTLESHPITADDFNMNYWPQPGETKLKVGEERAQAISKNGKPLNLAQYFFAYKNSLYIAAVKAQARTLVKGVGEGVCTEARFLEL